MIMGFIRLFIVIGIPAIIVYLILNKIKPRKKDFNIINENKSVTKTDTNKPTNKYKNRYFYTEFNDDNTSAKTTFRIAGVTFKDGKYSRQAALKKLSGNVPPMNEPINFEFEEYLYEDSPAVRIICNGRILGNVPADAVDEFLKLKNSCKSFKVKYKILGGFDVSYGCELKITWRF